MNIRTSLCLWLLMTGSLWAQGPLLPPGAPEAGMKTLDQLEPRIPITNLNFIISAPGSYYLTTNLYGAAEMDGLIIAASGVTLDLGGFSLVGGPGSSNGIRVVEGGHGLVVRNGAIQGWGGSGLEASVSRGALLEGLSFSNNGSWAMLAGEHAVVSSCRAVDNPGGGIVAGYHSVVRDCVSALNGGNGFELPAGALLRDCSSMFNAGAGVDVGDGGVVQGCTSRDNASEGFALGAGCLIRDCTALANAGWGISMLLNSRAEGCVLKNNANGGLSADLGCTITGCDARQNLGLAGILVRGMGYVLNNLCIENNDEAATCGFRIEGSGNRVEGNHAVSNYIGFLSVEPGNLVIRNSAQGNSSAAYELVSGTSSGVLISTLGGGTVSGDPWANIEF